MTEHERRSHYASGDYATAWGEALGETIDRLDGPVAVIADTPDLKESPSICRSARFDDALSCGKSREFALDSITRPAEQAITASRGVPMIDLTDFICDVDWCGPITGDVMIYRDAHHLTDVVSTLLGDPLGEQLRKLL